MKYFIISDIHSNLEALNTMIMHHQNNSPDAEIVCLGDIIGYGADVNECLEIVFNKTNRIIMGNHEAGLLGKMNISLFNSYARNAVDYTESVINRDFKKKLYDLKYSMKFNDSEFYHSSISKPMNFNYITSIYQAEEEFKIMKSDIAFIGHTHIPVVFIKDRERVSMNFSGRIKIEEGRKYIVNVGSVGQPRNNDSRACAVLWDSNNAILQFIRLEYDFNKTQSKIINAGLPKILADRLSVGI